MEAELTREGRSRIATASLLAYFVVAAVEVFFEMQGNTSAVYFVKPLLMPLLLAVYLLSARERDVWVIAMLVFAWIANIFFISPKYSSILIGAMFFFVFRALTIYLVFKYAGKPKWFPLVISCIPFLFTYLYLAWNVHDRIGDGLSIFIGQCVMITFLGGLALGNYIMVSNRPNLFLLLSTLLFAATQFIFAARVFYAQDQYFHALAMALYVPAQYLFVKFVLLSRNRGAKF